MTRIEKHALNKKDKELVIIDNDINVSKLIS